MRRHAAILPVLLALLALQGAATAQQTAPQAATTEPAPQEAPEADVRVDRRVELLSIIFRLAGNEEYNRALVQGYARDVDERFGPLRDHAAVRLAAELREAQGVSYDAPMSLAAHLDEKGLTLRCSLEPWPEDLDGRWQGGRLSEFVEAARDFAARSDLDGFMEAHGPVYDDVCGQMRQVLADQAHLEWFDRYFGAAPGAEFHVVLSLLNGPGNYGVRSVAGDREEMFSILGVSMVGLDGSPRIGRGQVPLLVHEFCHSFVNPVVYAHLDELRAAGEAIWPHVEQKMRGQAYGSWQTMMIESLVRACTIRHAAAHQGWLATAGQALEERSRGFTWVPGLAQLLAEEYEPDRESYPTLDSFMPRVVRFFDDCAENYADEEPAAEAAVPAQPEPAEARLVAVDPRVELLSIVFRLAGNPEYNEPFQAAYAQAVDEHFGPYREHAVVLLAARFREDHGVSHDLPMRLAVALSAPPELRLLGPPEVQPDDGEDGWPEDQMDEFLAALRDFCQVSGFQAFFDSQRPLYDEAEARVAPAVREGVQMDWLGEYTGMSPDWQFRVLLAMLNGPWNYGTRHESDGQTVVYCVASVPPMPLLDSPEVRADLAAVVVHEFTHAYVSPVVCAHAAELEHGGRTVCTHAGTLMRTDAYSNWLSVLHESVVRACVARYRAQRENEWAGVQAALGDQVGGFIWVPALADFLRDEYEADRETYPTFESFMPRIVWFFEDYAKLYEDEEAAAEPAAAPAP